VLARATRRLVRQWLVTAEAVSLPGISAPAFAVTSEFPIVAVIGWRRPRLIIARAVLASCSPDELRAVLAHEQGHIDRRDNMRRLLLSIAPDVLAWLPSSERLFIDWRDAAEEAADDDAARSGGRDVCA
jgi:Zn-dependent protease with chaperone function